MLFVVSIGMKEKELNIHYCPSCGWKVLKERLDFVRVGLWPCDAVGSMFFEFRYMMLMSFMQHMCPELSLSSVVQALKLITTLGGKVNQSML